MILDNKKGLKIKMYKLTLWEHISFPVKNFIEDWIYPGWYLKNYLFNRHDLIKIPKMKPWEYADASWKMKFAIFELIKDFIEKEEPEKHLYWYKAEDGNEVGYKYGENSNYPIIFPERRNEWIMDIIKEIYNFYTKEMIEIENEISYLVEINHKYVTKFDFEEVENQDDVPKEERRYRMVNVAEKKSINDPEIQNLNWDIIMKYFDNKEDILDEKLIVEGIHKAEWNLENKIKYYMHLAVDMSPYLWT